MTHTRSKNKRNKRSHTKRRQRGGILGDIKKIGAYTRGVIVSGVVIPANLIKSVEYLSQISKEVINRFQMTLTYHNKMKLITLKTSNDVLKIKTNLARQKVQQKSNRNIRKGNLNNKKHTAKTYRQTQNLNNKKQFNDVKFAQQHETKMKKQYELLFNKYIDSVIRTYCSIGYIYNHCGDQVFKAYLNHIKKEFSVAFTSDNKKNLLDDIHLTKHINIFKKIFSHYQLLKSLPLSDTLDKSRIIRELVQMASDTDFFKKLSKSYDHLKQKQDLLLPPEEVPILNKLEPMSVNNSPVSTANNKSPVTTANNNSPVNKVNNSPVNTANNNSPVNKVNNYQPPRNNTATYLSNSPPHQMTVP